MLRVVSVDELLSMFNNVGLKENELVDINEINNRIAGEDITASENLPGFSRSSVDGYALKSRNTYLCSESMPAVLRLKGAISIGSRPGSTLEDMECMYVPTGGMLPEGSDAVAMIEDCEELGDEILINKSLAKWENVVFEDDDVKKGEMIIARGTVLKSIHAAILSGLGIVKVPVRKMISAGIISTGDELLSPYDKYEIPRIRDINGFYLKSALKEDGCSASYYGIVKDNEKELYETVKKALEENDIVFLSGGSSAGSRDYTLDILEELGTILFHGIAIKPGKPTLMAEAGGKFIVGLPGHPLSCAVVYKFIISEIIGKMYGRVKEKAYLEGIMADNYHKAKGREEYLPVVLKEGIVHPIYAKSSAISVMAKCTGFIRIGRDMEGIAKGEKVKILI